MATQTTTSWQLKGNIILGCNCDYGCPCNFNAPPTKGHCEGTWTWHIDQGQYGDVRLDGLNFTVAGDWPEAIHKGNGEVLVLIDERASAPQREALLALIGGKVGGPWAVLANTIARVHGPEFVPYEVKLDGVRSSVRAGTAHQLELEPMRNPVSGAEVYPGVVLPQGFVFKEAALASSRTYAVHGGVNYEHPGKYAAVAPFEYAGP